MSTATTIDPITMEILASGFHHIAEEMAVVEYRASYSPIIREMLDFNCGLFTGDGRMVANSEQIPAQLGLMQFALEAAREKWGDDIAEGDAVLTNHPYMGGTHTPDLQVFTPLYRDGRIIAWAGSIAHHIDIGGRFPGTESAQCTELFQEGLIFPAVKLVERGTRVRALYDLIGANVRDPASTLGDLDAQLAACRRGMARVDELADAHGTDTVLQGMETLLHTTALRAEAAFRFVARPHRDGRGLPRRRGIRGHLPGARARRRARRRRHAGGRSVRLQPADRVGHERPHLERSRRHLLRGARVPGAGGAAERRSHQPRARDRTRGQPCSTRSSRPL